VNLDRREGLKAIAEKRNNPWPNGTSFAKVAWFQRDDGAPLKQNKSVSYGWN
jgi:hypothetical protein